VIANPELLTGYVDGALTEAQRAEVESHLPGCDECRRQVDDERALRERLRALPEPPLPAGLEGAVRGRLAPPSRRPASWALPMAASLVLLLLWARGAAPFVAWELARDHRHCFGHKRLPAKVWSDDPGIVSDWFAKQGTALPFIPEGAGGLELVGARYCTLLDRGVAHLYYADDEHRASLFVLRGPARIGDGYEGSMGGRTVMVFRAGGALLGVVSERAEDAEAMRRRFSTMTVSLPPLPETRP
jgi:anti-sigma factor RsiW